jgi:alpha-glucosidase
MRRVADEFENRVLLGELYLPPDQVVSYFGPVRRPELQLPLNMPLAWEPWTAEAIGGAIEAFTKHVPDHGWPAWILGGHDCARLAARTQGEQTRIAAMLLSTLRGTPIFYYGDEIGMRGVPIPAPYARDPQGRRIGRNRDPERTPMQWSREANAGFTSGTPWLPIGGDADTANVQSQSDDPRSLLSLYRRLIQRRREDPTLREGNSEIVSRVEPLLAYRRRSGGRQCLVLLNFSGIAQHYILPADLSAGKITLSTQLDRDDEPVEGRVELRPSEGVIIDSA